MTTYDLFSYSNAGCEDCSEIDIPDAEVFLYPSLLSNQEADQLFDSLKTSIIWKNIRLSYTEGYMMSQDLLHGMEIQINLMFTQELS